MRFARAVCWFSVIVILVSLLAAAATAECVGARCKPRTARPAAPKLQKVERLAPANVPRVIHRHGRFTEPITGVLIDVHPTQDLAHVLTAAHLFTDAVGEIEVRFPNGEGFKAILRERDNLWDVAVLGIRKPSVAPMKFANKLPAIGQRLWAGGYPDGGAFRWVSGRMDKWVGPGSGKPFELLDVSPPVSQGCSGGPIVNAQGELVGIISGADKQFTTGAVCARIRQICDRVLRTEQAGPLVVVEQAANGGADGRELAKLKAEIVSLKVQLAALRLRPGPTGPTGPPGEDGVDGTHGQAPNVAAIAAEVKRAFKGSLYVTVERIE